MDTLVLTTSITIDGDVDGDGKADITITGDINGDDLLLEGTDFTDGINNTAYSDNVRVFAIGDSYTNVTANLNSLNITGGSASDGGGIVVTDVATLVLDQSNRSEERV